MRHSTHSLRPLFEPWCHWQELPEDVRQHALDVLTALYLETLDEPNLENRSDDHQSDH
jgi:hypothetical protein